MFYELDDIVECFKLCHRLVSWANIKLLTLKEIHLQFQVLANNLCINH